MNTIIMIRIFFNLRCSNEEDSNTGVIIDVHIFKKTKQVIILMLTVMKKVILELLIVIFLVAMKVKKVTVKVMSMMKIVTTIVMERYGPARYYCLNDNFLIKYAYFVYWHFIMVLSLMLSLNYMLSLPLPKLVDRYHSKIKSR